MKMASDVMFIFENPSCGYSAGILMGWLLTLKLSGLLDVHNPPL